ncbi:mucin-associated surface protein [Trypanosoma cruzi cruzi]|uniref:Mucin-associated surface protein (MASP) n=1 Tax=Trypanosoma cruzi TaxID=5693 RepID=A0A2V2V9Y2_TRYCR|nr:mucin-associated surface protein [Trypanosoma cruzi cruzi]PWU93081.1 Mucin-associated surface protein (MASP) [Trypanosoma cruzi]
MAMMTGRVLLVCALCVLWCGAGCVCAEEEDTADDGFMSGGEGLPRNPEKVVSAPEALGSPTPHSGVGEEEALIPEEVTPQTTEEIPEDGAEDEEENFSEEEAKGGRINGSTKGITEEEKKETPAREPLQVKDSHSPQSEEELEEKDNTEPKTRNEKKKEEGPPPPVSAAQPTTLATTQTPEVKLPGRKTPHEDPEGDASQKGLNDAQTLTHQKNENSSSQAEKTAEPPEDPSQDIVAEQQGQATATENLTENAPATNQAETTASSISTSDSVDAQRKAEEEGDNEIEALNPNEASILSLVNKNGQGKVIPSFSGEQQKQEGQPLGKSGAGGAPTSTLSTVTSSPAGKESAKHLASGTSPDGHQNVDGGSTADGYQTATTGYGDKTQEDGPLKIPTGNLATADANGPTTMGVGQDGTAVTPEAGANSAEDEGTVGGTDAQGEEGIHPLNRDENATALNSSLGNVSQGNNSDGGTMRGSGLLPSLLLLLLGLWGIAAL